MTLENKTTINALIDEIIQRRKPLSDRIERVISHVNHLDSELEFLQSERDRILSSTHDPQTARKLKNLHVDRLQAEIKSHLNLLKRLEKRFSRKTLNIGVVGRARQGKSRLLQSLTGLTREAIPDGERLHCTGVRSTIYHVPEAPSPHGTVYFHTEKLFLHEVIHPYYIKLGLENLPRSISEFSSNFRQEIVPENISISAEYQTIYKHLSQYHENLDKYGRLISKPELDIDKNQIRAYVAQDNLEGDRIYTNYLAVREVKIICQFPNQDIGKLALVDMPGLGDTGTGDEQRLIKTLGEDVDIILFVRMPKASGDHWADVDVRLYDTAREAIPELSLDLWSFMILNHYIDAGTNNKNNCEDLLTTIAENHIRVAKCFTTNCANTNDSAKMLYQVLEYMTSKIEKLDSKYAEHCQNSLLQWRDRVEHELNQAKKALANYGNRKGLFTDNFNIFWDNLADNLEDLVQEARKECNYPDKHFSNQVKKVIDANLECSDLPSQEDKSIAIIDKKRNSEGSYVEAYAKYLHRIRTRLSKNFLKLDGQMQESLNQKKNRISKVLADEVGFKELSNSQDLKLLTDINYLISEDFEDLKLGFSNLIDFNVTYAAIIQKNLREFLDELHPDKNPPWFSKTPTLTQLRTLIKKIHPDLYNDEELEQQTAEKLSEDLQEWLDSHPNDREKRESFRQKKLSEQEIISLLSHSSLSSPAQLLQTELVKLYKDAIDGCQQRLQKLLIESSQIRYVMVAEFVDRVLWSEGAKDNWRDFLRDDDISSKIWEDFRDIAERKKECDNWIKNLNRIRESNKVFYFNFLN